MKKTEQNKRIKKFQPFEKFAYRLDNFKLNRKQKKNQTKKT